MLFFLSLSFICLIPLISSRLIVNSPQRLINELPETNEIPYISNHFGKIPYDRSIAGYLILSNPINTCNLINSFVKSDQESLFLLSTRGNCTYVTKAKYAQILGVKLLIIIADEINDSDENLYDDGFGSTIHIPSIVIDEYYGNVLMTYLQSNDPEKNRILLTMRFDVSKIESKPSYIFWISSSNRNSFKLVRDFKPFFYKLQDYTKFEVHYLFWTCELCAQNNYKYDNTPSNCVSAGRYCCSDPDGDGEANGRDIVLEDLRQICLFNKHQDKFFEYIDIFDLNCVEFQVSEECSRDILDELNVDYNEIKSCVDESFIEENLTAIIDVKYNDNRLLKKERRIANYYNVNFWPSVSINNMSFEGNLESDEIFAAICSFFLNPPDVCKNKNEIKDNANSNSYTFLLFLVIVCLFLSVFLIMIRIYKKIVKRELEEEMKGQIQDMMNQYVNILDKK